MRGADNQQSSLVCLISPEERVPEDHPLRSLRPMVEEVLREMSGRFERMYSAVGRPSVPPERLLKASVLQALYSIRSERLLCEQIDYSLLFRWFLGMDMVEPTFDASTFSKNRTRLLEHDVAGEFFRRVFDYAGRQGLTSDEHFSVDGTLIEAWASIKSFRPKDEKPDDDPRKGGSSNSWVDFKGEQRSNDTHESKTDPEAKLARKGPGREAKLSYNATALMENRNGLLAELMITPATGTAERDAALQMLDELGGAKRLTVAGDRGFDTKNFVESCRQMNVTPHVAQKVLHSALDRRTTSRAGYTISQRIRKRIEEIFGWIKTVGTFRRTRFRGALRTQFQAYLVGATYNLIRIAKLASAAG